MSPITIRFAILTNQFDADGFLYCRDVRHVTDEDASSLLVGRLAQRYGGYVFVVDDRVWNSSEREPFDSEHMRLPVDSLAFSALLLDDLAAQVDERPSISCALSEMTSLNIEFVARNEVTITGVNAEGDVIYAPEAVAFDDLLDGLLAATEDFLRMAEKVLDREVADVETFAAVGQRQTNREFLDRWRAVAERLAERRT
jgi:hypothetical protein